MKMLSTRRVAHAGGVFPFGMLCHHYRAVCTLATMWGCLVCEVTSLDIGLHHSLVHVFVGCVAERHQPMLPGLGPDSQVGRTGGRKAGVASCHWLLGGSQFGGWEVVTWVVSTSSHRTD